MQYKMTTRERLCLSYGFLIQCYCLKRLYIPTKRVMQCVAITLLRT